MVHKHLPQPPASSACACPPFPDGERRMWCDRHQCWKTRNAVELCQTRPEYRAAWDAGRGPGQVHTTKPLQPPAAAVACVYRSQQPAAEIPGEMLECKCKSLSLYDCGVFGELVSVAILKRAWRNILSAWNREFRARYKGRSCDVCQWRTPGKEAGGHRE